MHDWIITGGSTHDSKVAPNIADTCKGFKYILSDSAYDSNQFYDYIFEKTGLMQLMT
ncbi:transposase [Mesotoga sp.]|uniref:transposase n=1 Tax=Mesotoga sp. TaxID=2053577 RepID=UPI00345E110B